MNEKKSVKRNVRVLEARDLMKATGGRLVLGFPANRHRKHKAPPLVLGFPARPQGNPVILGFPASKK